MADYFAICTRCKNSIFLQQTPSGRFGCPLCGEDFGKNPSQKAGFLIDTDMAGQAYHAGMEYFRNTDFREAIKYFEKTIEINPNHYLAVYYTLMCNIYEEEQSEGFDLIANVANTIIQSVDKVLYARVDTKHRLDFVNLVFNQCYILMSKHYSRRTSILNDAEDWDQLRQLSLDYAVELKRIIDIDREAILVHNPIIAKVCISIADLGISACQAVVFPKISAVNKDGYALNIPVAEQYYKARSLFSGFLIYARSLNATFLPSSKTEYGSILAFVDKYVLPKRERYYESVKSYSSKQPISKRFLSQHGGLLLQLKKDSAFAVQYAHRVCFRDLLKDTTDSARTTLVFESVDNCLEVLMPRIRLADKKIIDIEVASFAETSKMADCLNDFLHEMQFVSREYAHDKIDNFFRLIYHSVSYYYQKVSKQHKKSVAKHKRDQSSEYMQYVNFLYQVSLSCALSAMVNDMDNLAVGGVRHGLLELGKQASQEFMQLSDYDAYTEYGYFEDMVEVYNFIKRACGEDDLIVLEREESAITGRIREIFSNQQEGIGDSLGQVV